MDPTNELDPPSPNTDNAIRLLNITEPDLDSSARCTTDSDMPIEAFAGSPKSVRVKVYAERDGFHNNLTDYHKPVI